MKDLSFFGVLKKYRALYLLFVPVLVYYIIFYYIPMGGIVIAFKNYNFVEGIWGSKWIGFDNFIRFINNGDFWKVFRNTILINSYRLIFGFPIPIIFALLLNEVKRERFKRTVQTISYLPHFISWVVIYGMLFSFLSPTVGLVNNLIRFLGGDPVFFLGTPEYFRSILVLTNIWKEMGWQSIIYLAALANIDIEQREAAIVDGARRWHLLRYVTIPGIRNVISIMLILSVGSIMNTGFEQVIVLINDAVSEVGEIIDYYVYRVGLLQVNNYSYAASVGVFKSIIALILILMTNWAAKKVDEDGGMW